MFRGNTSKLKLIALSSFIIVIVIGCTIHLDLILRPQLTSMWCWAASGQMVMEYHDAATAPSQCVQANNRFGLNDCCKTPTPAHCVHGGWPEFHKYGYSYKTTSWAPLDRKTLQTELLNQRPIAFSWHWNGGSGHMMVAHGYQFADSNAGTPDMVEISDPWAPHIGDHRWITYDAYVTGSTYTHWNDYYEIQK